MRKYVPTPIHQVVPQTLQRVWGDEIIVAETPTYLGKLLRYTAGTAGGLQYHVEKDETFYLHEGRALVDYDAGDGTLTRVEMVPGMSFHIPPGAVHRFTAVTDCVVFEASTPHYDDRVRMEDHFGVVDGAGRGLPTTRA
jgi:mannose-6-phosphate isomerase-like protein (cupin superfamily)